jgi:PAS domain S-box-containing protein
MESAPRSKARPSLMSAPVITAEDDIRPELTARFLGDSPLAELAHVALGLTVTLLLIGLHPPQFLWLWFAALVALSFVRYRVRMHFAHKASVSPEIEWPVIASIVAVGLVWSAGAVPILLLDDRETAGFMLIVECGLAAAATFTFQATVTGFRVFIASIYVPLIIGFLSTGSSRWSITGTVLVVVYGATMLAIQRRGYAQLCRSYQLLNDLDRSRRTAEAGQAEVSESRARLFQFLESMPVGVIVLDKTANVFFSNAAARQMSLAGPDHETLEDLRRRSPAYVPGTQQPFPRERLPVLRALKGESAVDQIEILGADGLRLVEVHGSPIRDRDGQVAYAVAVISDLSGRQSADQRRAALHAVLSLTAEATSEDRLLSDVLKLLNERFGFVLAEMWMADAQAPMLRRVGAGAARRRPARRELRPRQRPALLPSRGRPARRRLEVG